VPFEHAPARGEALIRSSLSLVSDGRLFYRGQDAITLSQTATVEDAARLLWDAREHNPFAGLGPRLDSAGGVSPRTRLFASLCPPRRGGRLHGRQDARSGQGPGGLGAQ
jgi:citrate synthase